MATCKGLTQIIHEVLFESQLAMHKNFLLKLILRSDLELTTAQIYSIFEVTTALVDGRASKTHHTVWLQHRD